MTDFEIMVVVIGMLALHALGFHFGWRARGMSEHERRAREASSVSVTMTEQPPGTMSFITRAGDWEHSLRLPTTAIHRWLDQQGLIAVPKGVEYSSPEGGA